MGTCFASRDSQWRLSLLAHRNKKLPLARELFGGRDFWARRPGVPKLLRLLRLVAGHGRSAAIAGQLLEVILQQADFDAAAVDALGLRSIIRRDRGVAHADEIDAVDRDLMRQHQVANYGLGHLLRGGDCGLAFAGRESLNLEDVAALTLHAGGHLVQSVFLVLAHNGLAGAEADFSLVRGLVLIDVAAHVLDVLYSAGDLLRGLLRRGSLVAGVDGVLIGCIGLIGGQLDAGGGARIDVLDLLAVAGSQFIELIHAVADRLSLALHIFLAGERIDPSPEAFARRSSERRLARSVAAGGISRRRLSLRGGGLGLILGRRG